MKYVIITAMMISQDLVDVQHHVLGHNLLVARRIAHQGLQELVESGNVKEFNKPGQSE